MFNDRNSFSTFKMISLPIVIDLGDNNSVTATHYCFVNVIQGYQVETLHRPTIRLSLLSINQLNMGGHATIFQKGQCSRSLQSSCTPARKLMDGIYIIVTATALLSSRTENRKQRKRESSPPRESKPPRPPTTAKTKTTRNSLTITESRLWPQRLAHLNPPTMKTLNGRYIHADSMYTACTQAK